MSPAPVPADDLERVLTEARSLGFLGPGPVPPQIDHARGFASMPTRTPESFLDLGSGGGLPGLVLAATWPDATGVLLDAMRRRAEFLEQACGRLGVADRISVVCERAEVAAHDPTLRERFDLVTARSFGPPAATAECAVGFLRPDGELVVSEPPEDVGDRWPAGPLAGLGLAVERTASAGARFVVLRRTGPVGAGIPRRTGVPEKRPRWR